MAAPELIEQSASWPEILRLKDSLSLRELSQRFQTSPGAISAAFKRTGTVRVPPQAGAWDPSSADVDGDDLPPEPGEEGHAARGAFTVAPPARAALGGEGASMLPEVAAALSRIRAGSKDALIAQHAAALGQVPDAEVARRAGVSVRTIASFRARHHIPGYRGPRRGGAEGYDDDDAEVTPTSPSGGRAAEADARGGASPGIGGQRAWRVTWTDAARGRQGEGVVLAGDVQAAAGVAARAVPGEVTSLTLVGALLDG
jgi:hypothetical protein